MRSNLTYVVGLKTFYKRNINNVMSRRITIVIEIKQSHLGLWRLIIPNWIIELRKQPY